MNALQSYSSDDNSEEECRPRQATRGGSGSGVGDHGTNYDDVGMDISEESGDESGSGSSTRDASRHNANTSSSAGRSNSRTTDSGGAARGRDVRNGGHHNNHHHQDNGSSNSSIGSGGVNSGHHRGGGLLPHPTSRDGRALLQHPHLTDSSSSAIDPNNRHGQQQQQQQQQMNARHDRPEGTNRRGDRLNYRNDQAVTAAAGMDGDGSHEGNDAMDDKTASAQQRKEDKQYSSIQERLLGLASGKAAEISAEAVDKRDGGLPIPPSGRRGHDDRRSSRDDRRSRSPKDRHSGSGGSIKSRRSRSPGGNRRRSRSRSKSRERRSKSKDRRSRDRRSRSRDRRDRRRRSRSHDRRRDYRKGDSAVKPGLLPLPVLPVHSPALLATPPIPPLPAYYNPNSVNALKYAEQERKKKLLWGSKSGDSSGNSGVGGSITGLLTTPVAPNIPGLAIPGPQPPAALLALARNNPTGRELNLGLGKNQFSVGASKQPPLPPAAAVAAVVAAGRELNLGLGKAQSSGGGGSGGVCKATPAVGMADLWSTTTFNNDSDGKMAEKFKRLMGVKNSLSAQPTSGTGNTAGEKLTEKQEDMFSNMERQYEVARLATHTHKGFGLGFTSSAYLPK